MPCVRAGEDVEAGTAGSAIVVDGATACSRAGAGEDVAGTDGGGAVEVAGEVTDTGTTEAADPGNLILTDSSAGSNNESAVGWVDIFSRSSDADLMVAAVAEAAAFAGLAEAVGDRADRDAAAAARAATAAGWKG